MINDENANCNGDDDEPEPGQVIAVGEFSFKFGHLFKTNLSPYSFSEQYEVSQKLDEGIFLKRSPVQTQKIRLYDLSLARLKSSRKKGLQKNVLNEEKIGMTKGLWKGNEILRKQWHWIWQWSLLVVSGKVLTIDIMLLC